MNKSLENIEAYLHNLMTGKEQDDFKKELKSNPNLQNELDMYEEGNEILEHLVSKQLQNDLDTWWDQAEGMKTNNARIVGFSRRSWIIAAGLGLLISVAGWLLISEKKPNKSPHAIADRYIADISISHLKGNSSDIKTNYIKGCEAFDTKNYEAAITILEKVETGSAIYYDAQMIIGYSYAKLKKWNNADLVFNGIIENGRPKLSDEASYLQILTMIKGGQNKKEIQALLDKIVADEGHDYNQKARTLKEALN